MRYLLFAVVLLFVAPSAEAQQLQQRRIACGEGLVELHKPQGFRPASFSSGEVGISFIGHSTFLIRSPQDVKVITDYNPYFRADVLPDIATMNTDRANHMVPLPEPGIAYPLYGWNRGNGMPHHDVTYKDVRVYSEPTNIYVVGGRTTNETAIFVIQTAGLCIAHLGHTAHILDGEMVRKLGRIDIAMTPVDRMVTSSYEEIVHNIQALHPRVVIPMHTNTGWETLQLLAYTKDRFKMRSDIGDSIVLSREMLPENTQIWVLQPRSAGRRFGTY
jgi:L-ascorbate metabolism protein UlaG (beta-lactamase superfamily)